MKNRFVDQLKAGEMVDDVFLLSEKKLARKKDGNPYLTLSFSDKTGIAKGVMWDNADEVNAAVKTNDFVRVEGSVSEFRGAVQIVAKSITAIEDENLETGDFVPTTSRNIAAMTERLMQLVDSIETECLKRLMHAFLDDPVFLKAFQAAPAAKMMHHAYVGGLLEHTLSLAILVERVAGHYSGVDRDLLITGAMLHDIGKVREFEAKPAVDYSDEGRLLSHIIIGLEMITERIHSVPDFPADKAVLLKHLIISHHGTREYGSPEPPKTLEGLLLNFLDEIDSKINGVRDFVAADAGDGNWTAYHGAMGRHFFKGFNS